MKTSSEAAEFRILLVEDNPIDARAAGKALAALDHSCRVDVVDDGDAAISYLTERATAHPDLVLLDLNLPGRDGIDVLDRVKTDPDLRRTPIIVLTTSVNDADVVAAYDRGANAYLSKPGELAGWRELMEVVESFWLRSARLPPS